MGCIKNLLDTQIAPGGSKPLRSVDRTMSAGRINTATQRNPPPPSEPSGHTGTKRVAWDGTRVFKTPSVPRADLMPQSYIYKYHQERAGFPGVPTHL